MTIQKESQKYEKRFYKNVLAYLGANQKPLDAPLLEFLADGKCIVEEYDIAFPIDSDEPVSLARILFYIPLQKSVGYKPDVYNSRLIDVCRQVIDPKMNCAIMDVVVSPIFGEEDEDEEEIEEITDTHEFTSVHQFYPYIQDHCLKYFNDENYFYAVFEAAKYYVKRVRALSGSAQDGFPLMMEVFKPTYPLIRLTPCCTDSEKTYQDGFKFLSTGIVNTFRNPLAHDTEDEWHISKEDCVDILHFISFMLRKLDGAVNHKDS